MDADPYSIELAWGQSPFMYRVNNQFARIFASSSIIKDPKFFVQEDGCNVGFPLGIESAKYLLSDEVDAGSVLDSDIIKIADRAFYKHSAEKLLSRIVLLENKAKKKGERTFTVCKLLEDYTTTPRVADLKGCDKVVYDFLSSKTYTFEIKKRRSSYDLRVISYPRVHVAKEVPLLKIPA